MSAFDDRKKGYEAKFARDAELKFKAEARRNKLLAEWAAAQLGKSGDDVAAYVKEVRRADFEEAGDDDVFRKVKADFEAGNVSISDEDLRAKMDECLADAVNAIENDG
ncbi:MAG: DUF1476 domain-containing protein [Pseudomonadota bacterium]